MTASAAIGGHVKSASMSVSSVPLTPEGAKDLKEGDKGDKGGDGGAGGGGPSAATSLAGVDKYPTSEGGAAMAAGADVGAAAMQMQDGRFELTPLHVHSLIA